MTETCESAFAELDRGASMLGLELTEAQRTQYVEYCAHLLEATRTTNLTAVREPGGVMRTLFLDSMTLVLALVGRIDTDVPLHLVDVGAGAGFPGLPLKIAFPAWRLSLVESIGKKARFLEDIARRLDLHDVAVLNCRAEDAAAVMRDDATLCTARAVSGSNSLIELCAPLVRPGGWLIFPRSGDVEAEVGAARRAARELRCRFDALVPVPEDLGLGSGRVLVVYQKVSATPRRFPRRVGLAQSQPL